MSLPCNFFLTIALNNLWSWSSGSSCFWIETISITSSSVRPPRNSFWFYCTVCLKESSILKRHRFRFRAFLAAVFLVYLSNLPIKCSSFFTARKSCFKVGFWVNNCLNDYIFVSFVSLLMSKKNNLSTYRNLVSFSKNCLKRCLS